MLRSMLVRLRHHVGFLQQTNAFQGMSVIQNSTRVSIIIISIQPEGRFWQEPEPSQATGMALAHSILGSFLGQVAIAFPRLQMSPLSPLGASTCKRHERPLSAKDGITGEKWPVNFACDFDFHVNPGFFDMPRKSATWETALLPPPPRKACCGFYRPKNPTASAGIEPAILGTRGQHANHQTTEAAYL